MATYWWKRKDGGGAGTGSQGDPFNGAKVLDQRINDGTIVDGDIIEFNHTHGQVTLASDGADWANTTAVTSGFSMSSGPTTTGGTRWTNVKGIVFGTSQGIGSSATNLTFSFSNVTGSGYAFDMRGATTNSQRMIAALRIKGEGITVRGFKCYPPDWSYICDDSVDPPTTRITPAAGIQAEQTSNENCGLLVFGNGNTIEDCEVDGTDGWCRYGIMMYVSGAGITDASSFMTGYCQDNVVIGVCTGIEVQAFGGGGTGLSGYHLEKPTIVHFRRNLVHSFCWGRSTLHLPTGSGNSAAHGNGLGVQGRFFGGCLVYENEVYGDTQDGVACGSACGTMVFKNYLHDIGQSSYNEWYWTGSVWDTRTVTSSTEGNGIKMGLGSRDNIGPTTWQGTDGTASTSTSTLMVDELRNVAARNVIRNMNGAGITLNCGRGNVIHANEIIGTLGPGINLTLSPTATQRGQVMVTHNFVKKTAGDGTGGTSNFAILIQQGVYVNMYNNVFWSNNATGTNRDLRWTSTATLVGKDKNVMVTNRADGTGYNTTGDMDATARTDAQTYVQTTVGTGPVTFTGGGYASGSLLNAGSDRRGTSRAFGCSRNLLDQALDSTPNVGPI